MKKQLSAWIDEEIIEGIRKDAEARNKKPSEHIQAILGEYLKNPSDIFKAKEVGVEYIQGDDEIVWVTLLTEYESREVCYKFDAENQTWVYEDGENEPAMHNDLISFFHSSLDNLLATVRRTGGRAVLKI